jgi:DNA-directed RNA polymerase subunit E'/Rpb7
MNGPYFNTILEADVRIHPSQMDNNIAENIKNNLLKTYSNKCFDNYGYIDKIYDVFEDIKGGIIRAEDTTSSSLHRVKFRCRICNPVKKSVIVGKIVGINNMIIIAENGPIKFIIGSNNINTNNIKFKKSAFYPVNKKGELINQPIKIGSYVMIKVMNKKIVKNKSHIVSFGRMESVVLNENVQDIIKSQYELQEDITSDKLLKVDDNMEKFLKDIEQTETETL